MPSTAMLQTKVGTFLKAARSARMLSGICCAAITSIEMANAKAASIKVSSRVICIPRSRNPCSRGNESRSAGIADAISSFRLFMRFADQQSTALLAFSHSLPQLIRNARKQEDRHHLFPEPSAPFRVLGDDESFSVKKRRQLANVPRLDELIREFRGQKVIFDTYLARLYRIPTF